VFTLGFRFAKIVYCVQYSPDGHRIIAGGDGGMLGIWDRDTGKEIRRLEGHICAVSSPHVCLCASLTFESCCCCRYGVVCFHRMEHMLHLHQTITQFVCGTSTRDCARRRWKVTLAG